MITLAIRSLAIALGVTSVTLLASTGLNIHFDPIFLTVLKSIEAEMIWLLQPLEVTVLLPILQWLGEFGISVELQQHWKHVFVLLWLFFGAFTKAAYSLNEPRSLAFNWAWAFLAALGTATAVGTLPLQSNSVLWWSLAGFVVWWARVAAPDVVTSVYARDWKSAGRPLWVLFWAFVGVTYFAPIAFPDMPLFLANTKSPGLATLAILIAALAIVCVLFGALARTGPGTSAWERFLNDTLTKAGLEILSVLGGAAALALASWPSTAHST